MKLSRLFLLAALGPVLLQAQAPNGAWDLTIKTPDATYPSWLNIVTDGAHPAVQIVGRVASVHPAQEVKVAGQRLTFTSPEYFGKELQVNWDITVQHGKLSGTQRRSDGITGTITGERAPALDRPAPTRWQPPVPLFNGQDLAGWEPLVTEQGKPTNSYWKAKDGVLVNEAPGANLRTVPTFQDFKLHLEFQCPSGGNSGVYLRGRYEMQVEYEQAGHNDALHGMGSIYGFLAPAQTVSPRPGQWETLDITLVGRRVTIVRNGVTTIDRQLIPGITGGALDSHEGSPGPLYIQGDHTGGMKYRNITIAKPV